MQTISGKKLKRLSTKNSVEYVAGFCRKSEHGFYYLWIDNCNCILYDSFNDIATPFVVNRKLINPEGIYTASYIKEGRLAYATDVNLPELLAAFENK